VIEFEEERHLVERDRGPDLTPMIDMVFLLLIFFLLTSFVMLPSIQVDLPHSETAQVEETSEVSLTIKEDRSILLNGEAISKDRLAVALEAIYSDRAAGESMRSTGESRTGPKELVIQSDRSVSFGFVVEIMDLSRKAGAERISFLVEKQR
jgi:biopolymer transport protein ExbD